MGEEADILSFLLKTIKLFDQSAARRAAAVFLAGALTFTPFQAAANAIGCSKNYDASLAKMSAGSAARVKSMSAPYPVGVETIPGSDLSNSAVAVTKAIRNKQLYADCFIDQYASQSGKTQFGFWIRGVLIEENGKKYFEISELSPSLLARITRDARIAQNTR